MTERRIPPPRKGEAITALYLGNTTDRIRKLEGVVGARSADPVPSDPVNAQQTSSESWTETARTTTTVRIENPSDSSQFVDVERVVTITFDRGDGTTVVLNLS